MSGSDAFTTGDRRRPPLGHVFVSAVVPIHQGSSSSTLGFDIERLWQVLRGACENFEIVLVDDCSDAHAVEAVRPLLQRLECVRLVRLSRRFGADAALAAGLDAAIGDVVVAMNIGTDPPNIVPELVELCRKGSGAVVGIDPNRTGQTTLERWGARVFYRIANGLFDLDTIEHATTLMALSRPALGALLKIKEQSRYPQVFLPYIGFDPQRFTYAPRGRTAAKRGLLKSFERATDLLVTGSMRPLRWVSWLSLLASGVNVLYVLYVVLVRVFKDHVAEGWTTLSLQVSSMLFLLFLVLAVLSEYLGRVLSESRRRPTYVVRDELASSVLVASDERRNVVVDSK